MDARFVNEKPKKRIRMTGWGPGTGGSVLAGSRGWCKVWLSFMSMGRIVKISMLISLLNSSKILSHLSGLVECLCIEVRIKVNEP